MLSIAATGQNEPHLGESALEHGFVGADYDEPHAPQGRARDSQFRR